MSPPETANTAPHPPGTGASPIRILLVEDDDGDALLVEELLAVSGAHMDVVRAQTLADARREDLGRVDCVLLDLDLPDAQGLAALHRLKAEAPDVAVLVLTGLDDEQRGIEAVAAGAQDYLVKGQTDGQGLSRAVRYAVERRRADEARQQLELARAHAEENARLERGLLPAPLVSDPRLRLSAHYRPGRRRALLGGDFYDAVQDEAGAVHAVIGDVSGHGPDAAALGVCLRIAWRTLVLGGAGPRTSCRRSSSSTRTSATTTGCSPRCAWSRSPPTGARSPCAAPAIRRRCWSTATRSARSRARRRARRWAC